MDFQLERRDGRLCAAGDMNIYSAHAMKEHLLRAVQTSASEIVLDLSQVTELDTCGLQILLMARQLAAGRAVNIAFVAPSTAVRDVFALCGLDASPAAIAQVA